MEKQMVEEKVCEIIKESCLFNADNISIDGDLRENHGIDSIGLVELLIKIECLFDITVDSNLLTYDNFSTAKAISDYVYGKLNA
jgi:acyl carrier protein